jgi:hypothetical protein
LRNRIAEINNRTAQRLRDQFVDIKTLEKPLTVPVLGYAAHQRSTGLILASKTGLILESASVKAST